MKPPLEIILIQSYVQKSQFWMAEVRLRRAVVPLKQALFEHLSYADKAVASYCEPVNVMSQLKLVRLPTVDATVSVNIARTDWPALKTEFC